jgi:hypothetical protein
MARKPRAQVRTPGGPGAQPHSQPPRPQGGGGWAPLRDAVRRDVEQAASALAFAASLHERLEPQRRLFADFPRVMEQLRSGALERVATALARLFEGKEQFDLTRFLRDLPLALGQLAAAEAARKAAAREPASTEAAAPPAAAGEEVAAAPDAPAQTAAPSGAGESPASSDGTSAASSTPAPGSTSIPTPTSIATPVSTPTLTPSSTSNSTSPTTSTSTSPSTATPEVAQPGNGGAPAEPPSPRLELRSRLLAAAPELGKAVVTYRRTVATVRRAAAPRRAAGPWRSDREVLEEARLAVDFARQLFDAYAEAWADQPTLPGSGEAMSAETDRFLAWTQLARYMDVAAPRSQPPPAEKTPEKPSEKPPDKQPVTQGSAGAGSPPPEAEPAPGA